MQTVKSEPTEVVVYAAGSLRGVLTALGGCFEARRGDARLRFVFGAAGLLRDRLVAGEAAHVFASANMAHPQALASVGRAGVVHCFARNSLCVLTRMDVDVTAANVLDRLLDPTLRVAISTPTSDPSGDYALQLFGKVGAQGGRFRDAEVRLQAKALRLTGGGRIRRGRRRAAASMERSLRPGRPMHSSPIAPMRYGPARNGPG